MQTTNTHLNAASFIVRSARPEDIEAVASLDREMWGERANPPTLYRQLIDLYPETILVAHADDGRYAGCIVGLVRPKPVTGWILSVDIDAKFRGQGLGKLFVADVLAAFRRLDVETVVAIISPDNRASQRLFSSFGFSKTGLEKNYFCSGKDQDRWVLNNELL